MKPPMNFGARMEGGRTASVIELKTQLKLSYGAGVSELCEKPGARDWIEAEERKRGLRVEGWEE